jgi:predicted esterase
MSKSDDPPIQRLHGTATFAAECRYELHLPARRDVTLPLLIALHGISQSAAAFAATLQPLCTSSRAVLFPDGPYAHEVTVDGVRREGRAWYVYTGDQERFLESARRTASWIESLALRLAAEHGLDASRLGLLGYSQGGYLAGIMALERRRAWRGAVLVAARLKSERLELPAPADAAALPPILGLHGEHDRIVPVEAARSSAAEARRLGCDMSFETFPTGHRIIVPEIEAADRWLLARL